MQVEGTGALDEEADLIVIVGVLVEEFLAGARAVSAKSGCPVFFRRATSTVVKFSSVLMRATSSA